MIILLDNGHGGLIDGSYYTKGKQFTHPDGTTIYEGEFNRAIVARIIEQLTELKIPYVNIAPEHWDVSLETRVRRANKYDARNSVYISIHANAGGGTGAEFYTSPGRTRSDELANFFGDEFQLEFPSERLRTDFTDGDMDKEAKFVVLTKTKMPAILTENFFMDTEKECKNFLLTREGRDRIAAYHVAAITKIANL